MVISFEEKDRAMIEACGMTIIEFKRLLHRVNKRINDIWSRLMDIVSKFSKSLKLFADKVHDVLDNVGLRFEEMWEAYHYPTSRRYRVVKMLSKCTGIEKHEIWKMTRHTWLARSCC